MLTTHIQMQKENSLTVAAKVMELLNWKEEQYTRFKFSNGISYLHCYFGHIEAVKFQEYRKEYWNWWKNQWYLRDIAFIDNYDAALPNIYHVNIYRTLHNPTILACEIYPDCNLLGSRFERSTDVIEFLKRELLWK